jgi:hypothetical protein
MMEQKCGGMMNWFSPLELDILFSCLRIWKLHVLSLGETTVLHSSLFSFQVSDSD